MTHSTAPAPVQRTVNIEGYAANVYQDGNYFYPLTPCCDATATGTEDGICCRGCYNLIDPDYGMTFTLRDLNPIQ